VKALVFTNSRQAAGLFRVDFWEKILQFTRLVWLSKGARPLPNKY